MAVHSTLFPGIVELLAGIEHAGLQWGIVTNKPSRFTDPLLPQIGLAHAGCVVSGDTTAHAKPHPLPLLEAAARLGLAPEQCWYVGDDLRDIQAGQGRRDDDHRLRLGAIADRSSRRAGRPTICLIVLWNCLALMQDSLTGDTELAA